MTLSPLFKNQIVVDEEGRPNQNLQLFSEQTAALELVVGSGSPEGVIEARQKKLYMDTGGGPGTILYIKLLNDIGGNRKLGWSLV